MFNVFQFGYFKKSVHIFTSSQIIKTEIKNTKIKK